MEISRGIIQGAQKICLYGVEGIGKSYFASKFPNPVFIDTEGSTKHMDVQRLPSPSSWAMLIEEVKYIKNNPIVCDTLIIDTVDWAEQLCMAELCAKSNKTGIEDFGYGKGYTYLAEEFGRLLNALNELIEYGVNVCLVAHAQMRKFEQPDEMGAYDRWEMKLQKKVYPLVKEWSDMVLFANYKTYVIDADGQGTQKGTNKVQGGKRVMYTTHHPCWDAKNRHDLPDELPLDYDEIRHCIITRDTKAATPPPPVPPQEPHKQISKQEVGEFEQIIADVKADAGKTPTNWKDISIPKNIPRPLYDLMRENNVMEQEIQRAVASRGYYPADTPIENYDPDFVNGVLVGAWPQMYKVIKDLEDIPY
jgi:hypothetical protein